MKFCPSQTVVEPSEQWRLTCVHPISAWWRHSDPWRRLVTTATSMTSSLDETFKRWIRQLHPNDVVAKSVDNLPPLSSHWVFGWGPAEAAGLVGGLLQQQQTFEKRRRITYTQVLTVLTRVIDIRRWCVAARRLTWHERSVKSSSVHTTCLSWTSLNYDTWRYARPAYFSNHITSSSSNSWMTTSAHARFHHFVT